MRNLFLFLIFSFTQISYAQDLNTSDAVINKYLEVTKIKDNAANVKDMSMSYTTESQRGSAETEFKFVFPYKASMSVFGGGMEIMSMKYDGDKLQRKSGFGGGSGNNEPKTGDEAKIEAMKMNPFLEMEYSSINCTTSLLSNEKEGNTNYYVVEIKDSKGNTWKDYYNMETGFKDKTFSRNKTPRGEVESTVKFENYKTFKGSDILFAATKTTSSPMGEIVSELQTVKINKGIKDKDFEIK